MCFEVYGLQILFLCPWWVVQSYKNYVRNVKVYFSEYKRISKAQPNPSANFVSDRFKKCYLFHQKIILSAIFMKKYLNGIDYFITYNQRQNKNLHNKNVRRKNDYNYEYAYILEQ